MTKELTHVSTDKGVMVWVDIEATGLDERIDRPLELGIRVTNARLETLAEASWLVHDTGWKTLLRSAPQIVREMHTNNGLLDDLAKAEDLGNTLSSPDVAIKASRWLKNDLGLEREKYPMVGSNVGNYDRKFIAKRMPILNSWFHYRNIDISSVKELCKIYNPDLYSVIKNEYEGAVKKHRVLDDLTHSISELDAYLSNFMIIENAILQVSEVD